MTTVRQEPIRPTRSELPGRRSKDYCPGHDANVLAIGKHSGQWRLLLLILGLGITVMSTIAMRAYDKQSQAMETVASSVRSIDKVMTAYVASNTVESKEAFRRIVDLESSFREFDSRLTEVEGRTGKWPTK